MLIDAPAKFDVSEFFKGIYTFQEWEIFPGCSTSGPKNVLLHARLLQIPERLDGLRVLDIAPWNGFFGFECMRRGAGELVALGPEDPNESGFNKTAELLEIENCHYIRDTVYNLSPQIHGTFDIVLFLGLIYHLRHPLLALDRAYDVARGRFFIDSPIINGIIHDKTVSPEQREALLEAGKVTNQLPMTYFTKGKETGDPFNWFMPNVKCVQSFVESAGFKIDSSIDDGRTWISIAATRGDRSFEVGLEGYNQRALLAR